MKESIVGDQLTIQSSRFSHSMDNLDLLNISFSIEELEGILADENKFFIKYAENAWLYRYQLIELTARTLRVPSITSVWSDAPRSSTGVNVSKTEQSAIKKVTAEEWLNFFHESMGKLPSDFQELIKLKYLVRRSDGSLFNDDYVYDKMCISRSTYYRLKKKSLAEFGRILYSKKQH